MNETIKRIIDKHGPIENVGLIWPERNWTIDKDTGAINSHLIESDGINDTDYEKQIHARQKEVFPRRRKAYKQFVSKPKLRNRAA